MAGRAPRRSRSQGAPPRRRAAPVCGTGGLAARHPLDARALGPAAAHRHPAAQPGTGARHAPPPAPRGGCGAQGRRGPGPGGAGAEHLPGWPRPDAPRQWALEVTGPVVATSSAFRFVAPYTGLELFEKAGTVIGDNDGVPVTTPYDNCVLVMPSVRQARAGVTVVRFARRRAL